MMKFRGSMAGYEGGNSAWIELAGSGYPRRSRPSLAPQAPAPVASARANRQSNFSVANYARPKYHGVTRDQELSRMI